MAALAKIYSMILFTLQFVPYTKAATTMVDLSGPGCDSLDGYYLKNADDIISAYALPQYNTIATRDHCDVTIRADPGRRIEYMIESIFFNECGVEIRMYDNPTIDTNPIQIITCNYNSKVPIQGKTKYEVLRIRVRKTTTESRAFEFRIRMKNDLGPPMQFEKDAAQYTGQDLEPGTIAGIGIAGGVVVIGLICAAVFLCFYARNANLKRQKYTEESSGYTSGRAGPVVTEVSKQHSYPTSNRTDKTSIDQIDQWKASESRPPHKMRPVVPVPTQPAPRDPGRKSLSDRHRSGERTARPTSQTRHMNRRYETDA